MFGRNPVLFYSLLICLLLVLGLSVLVLRHFLVNLTVAASVVIMLTPWNTRLVAILKGRRTLAATLLVLFTVLAILIPFLAAGALVGNQAASLLNWIQPRMTQEAVRQFWTETLPAQFPWLIEIKDWLKLDPERFAELVQPALARSASAVTHLAQSALAGFAQAMLQLVLFLFILFFLLRDGHLLTQALQDISPLSRTQEREVYDHLARTIKAVLQSMVLVPLAQGLLAMVGFTIFGLPAPLFWGAMLILAAVIPGIGSPLVWLPASVYLLVEGATGRGIGLMIYGTLVISGIDNILKPMILRGSARIHPLLGFLAIIGGILAFGLLGFLIGPIVLSLLLSAVRIYRMDLLKSGTPDADPSPSQSPAT